MSLYRRSGHPTARRNAARATSVMALAVLWLATALAGCAPLPVTPPPTARPATAAAPQRVTLDTARVCHDCFWNYQEPGFRTEYLTVLRQRRSDDRLIAAELQLVVARVAGDSAGVCRAAAAFADVAAVEVHITRRLLAEETVAFTAADCGRDPGPAFRTAAGTARAMGIAGKAAVYDALAADTLRPLLQLTPIARELRAPDGTRRYTLGASAIRVDSATTVTTQMERVARDWLSFQLAYDFTPPLAADQVLDYHEGARLRELGEAGARVVPATGTLAVQSGGRWYAADSAGVFRFEVLPDKVQYPTTRAGRGVALLVDTHGISSLVAAAVQQQADLVVGCGDYTGKMEAAAYLAGLGIDVYFPTDRFVDEVLGYQGTGTLIGSAPVRQLADGAVIGDRPIGFDIAETVVAQQTDRTGELQYYDAPGRYFRRLAAALHLTVEYVSVDSAGQAGRVIGRARELGARAVALRVWTEQDFAPVRAWLAESPQHRAVLFHSAAYPAGIRLFDEFPQQTTFGDPRPVFHAR